MLPSGSHSESKQEFCSLLELAICSLQGESVGCFFSNIEYSLVSEVGTLCCM